MSRDGQHVATLCTNRTDMAVLRVWDVAVGRATTATAPITASDDALAWSADGRFLHIAGARPRRWERATGRTTVNEVLLSKSGPDLRKVFAWAPDGRRLAVGRPGEVRVWTEETGAVVTIPYPGTVTTLSWSAEGIRLAGSGMGSAGAVDGGSEIVVWEVGDGQVLATLRHHDLYRAALAWSSDASRLAIAVPHPSDWPKWPYGLHGSLILWEPATGVTTTLPGQLDAVTDVAWSSDGRHVITTSEDGAVVVHPTDGTPGSRLQLAGANCVAWEGSTIVVGQRTGPAVLELRTP